MANQAPPAPPARQTFESHAQPAMTSFIQDMTQDMAGISQAPPIAPPDPTPPPTNPEPKPAGNSDAVPPPANAEPKPAAAEQERPWPRNAKDWDSYKKADKERLDKVMGELTQYKTKWEEADKTLKKVPANTTAPTDYEQVKKDRDQFESILRNVAVENHPKFKTYFEGRYSEQYAMAEQIGGDKGKEIVELLKSPDSQWKDQHLSDLMTTLSPLQQSRIGGVMNNITAIASERSQAIAKSKEAGEALMKQYQDQTQAQQKERADKLTSLFDQLSTERQDLAKGTPMYQPRADDPKWNNSVLARVQIAKDLLFGEQTPENMINAALDAVAMPTVIEQNKAMGEELAQLRQQLKELQASQPTMAGQTNGSRSNAPATQTHGGRTNQAHQTPQSAVGGFMEGLKATMENGE